MKLTTDNFYLENKINDFDFNETYQKYCIHIIDNDNKTAYQLKQQILDNQEKLEKIEKRFSYLKSLQSEDMSAEAFQEYGILKEILGDKK